MKKAFFAALVLALTLGAFHDSSWAAGRTSASLSAENIMASSIDKESGSLPIGTIITWPFATLPAGGDWLECNGQTVNATAYPEYVKQYGNTVPDYRGVFLRARGGNAGALNVLQTESVNVPQSAGIKMHLDGIAKGEYYSIKSTSEDNENEYGTTQSTRTDTYNAIKFRSDKRVTDYERVTYYGKMGGAMRDNAFNAIGVNKEGMDVPIAINSPYKETRPANKAVLYVIKVR